MINPFFYKIAHILKQANDSQIVILADITISYQRNIIPISTYYPS